MVDLDYDRTGTSAFNQPNFIKTEGAESNFSKLKRIGDIDKDLFRLDIDRKTIEYRDDGFLYGIKRGETESQRLGYWLPYWMEDMEDRKKMEEFVAHKDNTDLSGHFFGANWYGRSIKLQYDKDYKFINVLPIKGRHPDAPDTHTRLAKIFDSRNKVLRRAFVFDKEKKHENIKWKPREEQKQFYQYTKPEDMTDKPNMWLNELYQIFEDNIPDRIEEFFRTDEDRKEGPGWIDPHSNTGYENLKKDLYQSISQKEYDKILPQEKKDIDKYLLTKPARDFFIHTLKSTQDIKELLNAMSKWVRRKSLGAQESISKWNMETHDPRQFIFEEGEPWVDPKDKVPDEGHLDLSKYSDGWQMLLGIGLPKDSNVEFISKGPHSKPLTAEGTIFKTMGTITPYSGFFVAYKGRIGLPGALSGIPVRYRDKRKTQSVLALKKTISRIEGMKYKTISPQNFYKWKRTWSKTGLLKNIELQDDYLMGMMKILKTDMVINAAAGGGVYFQELLNMAGSDGDGDMAGEMFGMLLLPAILNGVGGTSMELLSLALAGTIKNSKDRAWVLDGLAKKGYIQLEDISIKHPIKAIHEIKSRWDLGVLGKWGDKMTKKYKNTINAGFKKNVAVLEDGGYTYVATPGLRGKELKGLKQIRNAIKKLPPDARDDLVDNVVNMKRLIERAGIPEHEIGLMLTDLVNIGIFNAVKNKQIASTQVGRISAKVSTEDLLPSQEFDQAVTRQYDTLKKKISELVGKYGDNPEADVIFNKLARQIEATKTQQAKEPLDAATNVKLTIRQMIDWKKSGQIKPANQFTKGDMTDEEMQFLTQLAKKRELGDEFFHISTRNRILSHIPDNYSKITPDGWKTLDIVKFKKESNELLKNIVETKHAIGKNLYSSKNIDEFHEAKLQLQTIKTKAGKPTQYKRPTSPDMTIETVLDPTELYNNMVAANKHIISPLRMQSKQLGSEMLVTEYFRTVRNRGLFKFLNKNKSKSIKWAETQKLLTKKEVADLQGDEKKDVMQAIYKKIHTKDISDDTLHFYVDTSPDLAQTYDFRLEDLLELNGVLHKTRKKLSADAATKQAGYYVNEMATGLNNALAEGQFVNQTGAFLDRTRTGLGIAQEYWKKYIVNAEYHGAGRAALGVDQYGNRITATLNWTDSYLKEGLDKSIDVIDRHDAYNNLFFKPTQKQIKKFKISEAQLTKLADMRGSADNMLEAKFTHEFGSQIRNMSKDDFAQDIAQGFTNLGYISDEAVFPQLQPIINDVVDIAGRNRKNSKKALNDMGAFLDTKIANAEYLGNKIKAEFIGKKYVKDMKYDWLDDFARSITDPKKHTEAVEILTNAGRKWDKKTQFGDPTRLDQLFELLSKSAGKDTVAVQVGSKRSINPDVKKELDAIIKKEKLYKIDGDKHTKGFNGASDEVKEEAILKWSRTTNAKDMEPIYLQTGGKTLHVHKKDLHAVRGLLLNGVIENPSSVYTRSSLAKRLGGNAGLADDILLAARNEGDFGIGLKYLLDNEELLHRLYPGKEGAKHLSQVKDVFSLGFSLFNDSNARKLLKIGNAPGEYTIAQLLGRGYNISKGVVSPRYVLSELAINMMRQAQYRLLFDVVKNKKSADIMYDLLINDQALPLGFERLFRGWFLQKVDEWLGPEAVEDFKKQEQSQGHFNKDMNEYNMAGLIKLNEMGDRTLVSGNKQLEYEINLPRDFFSGESRGLTTKSQLERLQKKPGEFGIYPKPNIRTKEETEDQMNKLNIPKKTEQIEIQG